MLRVEKPACIDMGVPYLVSLNGYASSSLQELARMPTVSSELESEVPSNNNYHISTNFVRTPGFGRKFIKTYFVGAQPAIHAVPSSGIMDMINSVLLGLSRP